MENESVALKLTKDQEDTNSYSDERFEEESSSTTTEEETTSSIESVSTSVDSFERSTTVNKNGQVEEIKDRQCERVSVDKQASDLEKKQVSCERPEEVSSLVDESAPGRLTGKVLEKRLLEQTNLTDNDGDHFSDHEESLPCGESTAGIQLKEKQSIWKFRDNDDDQDNALDNIRVHVPKNNKNQEQGERSKEMSKSVDESQRPSEINDDDDEETEKRTMADGVLEGTEVSWSLSVSDNDEAKFEQQKEQLKSRIQQQLRELEKEHALMLEELTQVSNVVRYFERDDAIVEEEGFENLLNERDETLETKKLLFNWNENQPELGNEKVQDPSKITSKVLMTFPQEERCNLTKIEGKLTEEDELNLIQQQKEENRDRNGIRHQLMDNDTEMSEDSLHDVGENSADKLKGELILIQKELKETVSILAQKNAELVKARGLLCNGDELFYEFRQSLTEMQQELEETKKALTAKDEALELAQKNAELVKARGLFCNGDELFYEFRQSLTEMQQELEETKKALTAKDEALESTSAYANYKDSVVKKKLAKVVLDVKRVVKLQARLQSLLQEKDRSIEGKDIFIAQLKQDLKQYDTYVKEKDNDIGDFKTTLMELKRNLKLSRSSIREKGRTIEELESSSNALKQELDIKNSSLTEKDDQIKQLEFSIAKNTKDLEQSSSSLKERNNQIKDLDSSVQKLKEFLELTNMSLNERSNELQQMKSYVEEKERELDISNGKSLLLLEENSCLKNESALMKTQLCQSEEQINDLKKVSSKKNSELTEVNRELEKLGHLLQEKEQTINFLQRSLASKEHDNNILTNNMRERFLEIRSLKGTLDEAKNERRKFSELFNLKISYYETKIQRLNLEVDCNNILLGKKERALETAKLGIQAKEGEVDMLKERLCKQEVRFELYKKISTEAEYKLLLEKRTLEKSLKEMESGVCEKSNERMEVKSFPNARKIDAKSIEKQHSNESNEMEENYSHSKEMEEQSHLTAAESLAQMKANIAAMKKELEKTRENNATLSKSNKELKEKVNKLQKEAVDREKRLNETLDKLHERDAEISRLNGLLQRLDQNMVSENVNEKIMEPVRTKETEGTTEVPEVLEKTDDVSRESSEQNDGRQENAEPSDVTVYNSMKYAVSLSQLSVDGSQKFHVSRLINKDGLQEEADPVVPFDGKIQETIDAEAVESDDCRKDVQGSWDTTGDKGDLKVRENGFQKMDNSAQPVKNDELHDIAEHDVLGNDFIHDLLYVMEAEGTSQDTNDVQITDPVPEEFVETRNRVSRLGSRESQVADGLQDITEPEILVNSLVKGLASPQVAGVSSQDTDDSEMTDHVQKETDFESLLPADELQGRDDLPLVR